MIFSKKYTVRMDDVGRENSITNASLMSVLEDIAGLHSNDVGMGLLDVEKNKKAWMVLDWKIDIIKRPVYNQTITVNTWSSGMSAACGLRDFEILDDKGERIAVAASKWVYIDLVTRKPIRLTSEIGEKYGCEAGKKAYGCELKKLSFPVDYFEGDEVVSMPYRILRRDIDINGHMHNVNYLDAAYEILSEEVYDSGEPSGIRIAYKKEILKDDKITIKCVYEENKVVVLFTDDNNCTRAVIQFTYDAINYR